LTAAIFISTVLFILSIVIMTLIGKKISEPIALAAKMSQKIASGDLTHVLTESSTDETGDGFLYKRGFSHKNMVLCLFHPNK